jgi:hypothetical protein
MMNVWIEIQVDEFEDFLDITLDDLVNKHGQEMYSYLSQFLISIGTLTICDSSGKKSSYRF